jgi:hypothetical protein
VIWTTLPEDCENSLGKKRLFWPEIVAEIRICALHQYGASMPSITADDEPIHAGFTQQPCRVARGRRPTQAYIAVQ